jgi:hypothetical protein
MNMNKRLKSIAVIAAGTMVLLTAGCKNGMTEQQTHLHNFFPPDSQQRQTPRIMETQMAAGARADGTLYPQHFDGAALSSLGTAKLDLMLRDSHACNPLVVYLAVPNDTLPSERRQTVSTYLANRGGLKADQIVFKDGPNPSTYNPSAPNLKNYDKTDTGSDETSASSGPASGAPTSTGGAMH